MTATAPAPDHTRPALLRNVLLLLVLVWLVAGISKAQGVPDTDGPLQPNHDVTTGKRPLTNDTVERMVKAGIDDSIILQTIRTQPGRYDLGAEDLIALKEAGVSTRVMSAMQLKVTGLMPRAEPVADDKTGTLPPVGVDEVGVYYKDKDGAWTRLKLERMEIKSGGWVKSAFTHNIIKEDKNGLIDGPHSGLLLSGGVDLLIFAPEGTAAEEYDFLRFREHNDRREFRVYTGGVFHNETGSDRDALDFTPHKIAPRTYVFTVPPDIGKGDYGVLPPASSNTPGMSGTGKIFTFRIAE